MKQFTFLMCTILACLLKVNAQEPQFVSTEQQDRNVLIEEFTGRKCSNCPDGHKIVNSLSHDNPGRIWAVNIHTGNYSPTNYPNLNTSIGNTFMNAFRVSGFPAGVINRTTNAVGREYWVSYAKQQLQQAAECNVAGQVLVNHETRTATVNVEVYYTGTSASAENYLTVMMLQDSIIGPQSGANYNPEQVINDQYVHMHILRDVVTSTWGDAISPTTEGSLITRTYTYKIDEIIGDPNGVDVDINNILFLAFVTEKQNGSATTPVLNVAGLNTVKVTDKDFYPYLKAINIDNNVVSCSTLKPITVEIVNGGTKEITSLKCEVNINGEKTQYTWEGILPSYSSVAFEEELNIPVGNQKVEFRIVELNGDAYDYSESINLLNPGWAEAYFQEEEEEFKIDIIHDKYGNQVTWELIDSNEEVLASGGPYKQLATNGKDLQRTKVKIANNECVKFIIYDKGGDGINCGYGEGSYKITDSKGNVIVQGNGVFRNEISHEISTKVGFAAIDEFAAETCKLYPNPVKDVLTVEGEHIQQVNVFNTMGQLVKTVYCNDDNEVKINVNDLQDGMYFISIINNNGELTSKKVIVE